MNLHYVWDQAGLGAYLRRGRFDLPLLHLRRVNSWFAVFLTREQSGSSTLWLPTEFGRRRTSIFVISTTT